MDHDLQNGVENGRKMALVGSTSPCPKKSFLTKVDFAGQCPGVKKRWVRPILPPQGEVLHRFFCVFYFSARSRAKCYFFGIFWLNFATVRPGKWLLWVYQNSKFWAKNRKNAFRGFLRSPILTLRAYKCKKSMQHFPLGRQNQKQRAGARSFLKCSSAENGFRGPSEAPGVRPHPEKNRAKIARGRIFPRATVSPMRRLSSTHFSNFSS